MPRKGERVSETTRARMRAAQARRPKLDLRGARNPHWKGGRHVRADGRVLAYAPGHPGAVLAGGTYILEYRLIAEQLVGRPLRDDEVVHHINGDCTDNRLSNLEITTQAEHARHHAPEMHAARRRMNALRKKAS